MCQTNCSGHGTCDHYSKICRCKPGWIANPFHSVHGKKGLNCDWSILYLVLILLAPVLLVTIFVWLICCCCYKRSAIIAKVITMNYCYILFRQKRVVSNRRVRYTLLPEDSCNGSKLVSVCARMHFTIQYTGIVCTESHS